MSVSFEEVFDPNARLVEYPLEAHVVTFPDGGKWSVWGTAHLVEDIPFADYGCSAFPGLITIEKLDRLAPEGTIDFEDMPLNLLTADEQLYLISTIANDLNKDQEKINRWFAERIEP